MQPDTSRVTDDQVPAVATLLGPDAGEFLEAVFGEAGDTVASFRRTQVRYVPAKSITVQFLVDVDLGHEAGIEQVTLVATSGLDVPDPVPVMRAGDQSIAVWRFPHDPFLPGLVAATNKRRAGQLLERLGGASDGLRIRTRAYRAGRRAVVEATTTAGRIFMKVLRPDRVESLQQQHVELAADLPVPRSLGWSRDLGIVAMEAMPGTTLRTAIENDSDALPAPAQLIDLLDRFPGARPGRRVRGAWERAASHARILRAVVPEESDRIDAIVAALSAIEFDEPQLPVHGDFHSSQIMVDGAAIVGLVDVDTAGTGHRSDDLANIVGHLATVATISPASSALERYAAQLTEHFDTLVSPQLLRTKVAATIFGLATGPFRVQEVEWPDATKRRLDLTQQWLERSRQP